MAWYIHSSHKLTVPYVTIRKCNRLEYQCYKWLRRGLGKTVPTLINRMFSKTQQKVDEVHSVHCDIQEPRNNGQVSTTYTLLCISLCYDD